MSRLRKCDYCGVALDTYQIKVRAPDYYRGEFVPRVQSYTVVAGGAPWFDTCLDCLIKLLTETRDAEKAFAEGDVAKDNAACEALSEPQP